MDSDILLNTIFEAAVSSAKLLRTETGTWTRIAADTGNNVVTIPHGYESDDIFVLGWVVTTTTGTSEVFNFNLPYVSALGLNILAASWDDTNVYMEFKWDGTVVSFDTTYAFTIGICLV